MLKQIRMLKSVFKELEKSPQQVQRKLALWIDTVNKIGLEETRKLKAYHDEPLQGKRKGERSIRLNLQWRAIYIIKEDGEIEFVEIQEITPHAY